MTTSLLDVGRFANFMGRDAEDDAVWFAVEMAELLITQEVTVTQPPQAGLTAVAFSIAARLISAPPGVTSESEGGVSVSYRSDAGVLELTPKERQAIARITGRSGALGAIGLSTPGAGRRRFDPHHPVRPPWAGEKRMTEVDGYWRRGS